MNIRVAIFVSALLPTTLFASDKTDVIVMTNGDHITGEVKGLDQGTLYVSLDYVISTLSVEWSKVARLESKHLFIVKTEDGSVYRGTLHVSEASGSSRPVKIELSDEPAKTVELDKPQVIDITQTSDKFWQRFSGEISFGTIYSKGNQSTQYSLGSQTAYIRDRWSAAASLASTLSSSTGASAATRNQLTLGSQRLLPWNNYLTQGLANFLQSSEQNIKLQTILGGGIGRYLKNTDHATISLVGGLAWTNTNYKQSAIPQGSQKLTGALIDFDMKLFRFNKTNLSVSAVLLPALSQPGRVFLITNATYYLKFWGNFTWNVSFYGNWDNRPPSGYSGSDYGTSTGLSWTYGLK